MSVLVIGGGGLLGRHVVAAGRHLPGPIHAPPISWSDPARCRRDIADAVDFAREAAGDGTWHLLWCAGAAVVASPASALAAEVAQFEVVLEDLRRLGRGAAPATFFLASSAGGIYAGTGLPRNTEATTPHPKSAYADGKLAMERALAAADLGSGRWVGRITNLYGPGQRLDKGQGLVSTACRAVLTGAPMTINADLRTRRDYLYAGDAGRQIVAGIAARLSDADPSVRTKILCRGASHSIEEVLTAVADAAGRPVPWTYGERASAPGQLLESGFDSQVWPSLNALAVTSLAEGIRLTFADLADRS